MERTVMLLVLGVLVASATGARTCDPDVVSPTGGVVFPVVDQCFGDDVPFVLVTDDFADACDPELDRTYEPESIPEIKLKTVPPLFGGRLGTAVATYGDTVVAAFLADRSTAAERRTVQVYERIENVWTPTQRLVGSDGYRGDAFGRSIAIHGDWMAVGAADFGFSGGVVYVFRRDADGWHEVAKLRDPEPSSNRDFGFVLAMDDRTLAVATDDRNVSPTTGAVVVYSRTEDGWGAPQRLTTPGPGRDEYGNHLALEGDRLFVGAPARISGIQSVGAIYLYERDAEGTWNLDQRIDPRFATENFAFGSRFDVEGDRLAVEVIRRVRVDVYGPDADGIWDWVDFLRPFDAYGQAFACTVALAAGRAAVGACADSEAGMRAGAIYEFRDTPAGFVPEKKWIATDAVPALNFGSPIALTGDRIVAGAPDADDGEWRSGAVYVLEPEPPGVYRRHGNHDVSVVARDDAGNEAGDSVEFTIDRIAPVVVYTGEELEPLLLPASIPFTTYFETSDDDGVPGGVVREVLSFDGCPVFDGATYGDADGRLADEVLEFHATGLCAALRDCGRTSFVQPVVQVRAEDCGGNIGEIRRTARFDLEVRPGDCP